MKGVPSDVGRKIVKAELFMREVLNESYRLLDDLERGMKGLRFEAPKQYRWTPSGRSGARGSKALPRDVSQRFFRKARGRIDKVVEAMVLLDPGVPEFNEPLFMVAIHDLTKPLSNKGKRKAWLYDLYTDRAALECFRVERSGPVFRLRSVRGKGSFVKSIRGFALRLVSLSAKEELERCVCGPLRFLLGDRDKDAESDLRKLGASSIRWPP